MKVCKCKAYSFPHRLGGGDCKNKSLEPPFCNYCGNHCETFEQDVGEGPYEFHGQRGTDVRIVDSSKCCEDEPKQTQEECEGDGD